jgi:hypothetical protein
MPAQLEIVTLIEEGPIRDETQRWWRALERYGCNNAQTSIVPFMSFCSITTDDIEAAENAIIEATADLRPFEITIDGFGYFDSPFKTVFMRVIASDRLKLIQRALYDSLAGAGKHTTDMYIPTRWTPHIVLAVGDVTTDNLAQIKQDFAPYHPHHKQGVLDIQMVRMGMGRQIKLLNRYPLTHSIL